MEGGRGWGAKGVCVCVEEREKEAGRKRAREGGWRVLKLLMVKEGRG